MPRCIGPAQQEKTRLQHLNCTERRPMGRMPAAPKSGISTKLGTSLTAYLMRHVVLALLSHAADSESPEITRRSPGPGQSV